MNTRRLASAFALIVVTAVASAATGQKAAPEPYPTLAHVLSDESPTRMQIQCAPTSAGRSGRPRIQCRFAQTMILRPPAKAEVDREVAAAEADIRAGHAKNPAATWKDCAKIAALPPDAGADVSEEEQRDFERNLKAAQNACARKDIQPMIDAATETLRRKERTCTVGVLNEFSETLERADADTWVGTDGPRGTCNVTVTVTLWRTVSTSGWASWNFKQVRVTPETETGPECKGRDRVSVTTMRWNSRRDWTVGCQYLKL